MSTNDKFTTAKEGQWRYFTGENNNTIIKEKLDRSKSYRSTEALKKENFIKNLPGEKKLQLALDHQLLFGGSSGLLCFAVGTGHVGWFQRNN